MKTLVPQRYAFTQPELLSPAWTLTKGRKHATCTVWSHQFGFELRLMVGDELLRTQVVVAHEDLVNLQEAWRTALEAKGWASST